MQSGEFDFSSYGDQVRSFTRHLFGCARLPGSLSGCMHLLTTAVERDLQRFGNQALLARAACQPGCSTCCVVNVTVLAPEAIAIAGYLRRRLPPTRLAGLSTRIADLARETRWLDDEERLCVQKPCAFLDAAGWCTIHRVRPLLCRSMTSLDAADCRAAITAALLGEEPAVLVNLFQKALLEAAYLGLAKGLAELGLDSRPYRLAFAVHHLLQDEGQEGGYLEGQRLTCH